MQLEELEKIKASDSTVTQLHKKEVNESIIKNYNNRLNRDTLNTDLDEVENLISHLHVYTHKNKLNHDLEFKSIITELNSLDRGKEDFRKRTS